MAESSAGALIPRSGHVDVFQHISAYLEESGDDLREYGEVFTRAMKALRRLGDNGLKKKFDEKILKRRIRHGEGAEYMISPFSELVNLLYTQSQLTDFFTAHYLKQNSTVTIEQLGELETAIRIGNKHLDYEGCIDDLWCVGIAYNLLYIQLHDFDEDWLQERLEATREYWINVQKQRRIQRLLDQGVLALEEGGDDDINQDAYDRSADEAVDSEISNMLSNLSVGKDGPAESKSSGYKSAERHPTMTTPPPASSVSSPSRPVSPPSTPPAGSAPPTAPSPPSTPPAGSAPPTAPSPPSPQTPPSAASASASAGASTSAAAGMASASPGSGNSPPPAPPNPGNTPYGLETNASNAARRQLLIAAYKSKFSGSTDSGLVAEFKRAIAKWNSIASTVEGKDGYDGFMDVLSYITVGYPDKSTPSQDIRNKFANTNHPAREKLDTVEDEIEFLLSYQDSLTCATDFARIIRKLDNPSSDLFGGPQGWESVTLNQYPWNLPLNEWRQGLSGEMMQLMELYIQNRQTEIYNVITFIAGYINGYKDYNHADEKRDELGDTFGPVLEQIHNGFYIWCLDDILFDRDVICENERFVRKWCELNTSKSHLGRAAYTLYDDSEKDKTDYVSVYDAIIALLQSDELTYEKWNGALTAVDRLEKRIPQAKLQTSSLDAVKQLRSEIAEAAEKARIADLGTGTGAPPPPPNTGAPPPPPNTGAPPPNTANTSLTTTELTAALARLPAVDLFLPAEFYAQLKELRFDADKTTVAGDVVSAMDTGELGKLMHLILRRSPFGMFLLRSTENPSGLMPWKYRGGAISKSNVFSAQIERCLPYVPQFGPIECLVAETSLKRHAAEPTDLECLLNDDMHARVKLQFALPRYIAVNVDRVPVSPAIAAGTASAAAAAIPALTPRKGFYHNGGEVKIAETRIQVGPTLTGQWGEYHVIAWCDFASKTEKTAFVFYDGPTGQKLFHPQTTDGKHPILKPDVDFILLERVK